MATFSALEQVGSATSSGEIKRRLSAYEQESRAEEQTQVGSAWREAPAQFNPDEQKVLEEEGFEIIRSRKEARRQTAQAAAPPPPPPAEEDDVPEVHPAGGRRKWYTKAAVTLVVPLLGYALRRLLAGKRSK